LRFKIFLNFKVVRIMTLWEKKIVEIFAEKYPGSAAARNAGEARPLRLRADKFFPDFDAAAPDERESFLEAAETLEKRGLLSLAWGRHRKGECLIALVCRDAELLFQLALKPSPKTLAEEGKKRAELLSVSPRLKTAGRSLFAFIAGHLKPSDAAAGIDPKAIEDLSALAAFLPEGEALYPQRSLPQGITPRALSISLYGDSKRLEGLIDLFGPLLARARREGNGLPDFSGLDRSFPETFIAGKISIAVGGSPLINTPGSGTLINTSGSVLGLPLSTAVKIKNITPLKDPETKGADPGALSPSVLMVENKETFFVLAEYMNKCFTTTEAVSASAGNSGTAYYTCVLYIGGHPNRVVRLMITALAEAGFAFFHAGDLDPDGILILQELREIAGKPVTPVSMDAFTFDRYAQYGKKLEHSVLRRLALINNTTRAIPGIGELINRITETETGIEQEIIDYR
jgi:hypothetical protein